MAHTHPLRLKEIRKELGLTQKQLAAASGLRRETIYRIEGNHTNYAPRAMFKVCRALRLSPAQVHEFSAWTMAQPFLARVRLDSNYTQRQVCGITNICVNTLIAAEQGKRLSTETKLKLAELYKLSPSDVQQLFDREKRYRAEGGRTFGRKKQTAGM